MFISRTNELSTIFKGFALSLQVFITTVCFCSLGVHQVALLTHVDQVCLQTAKDITGVYESRTIQDVVS